ncbi:MAG: BrnA antitoxin family protein [Alphaproteobacteria bacterium GM202ARS2]|nr:BrnA antitoxin family protein [Alphaproteobacteria bacterium GM202ARS2]
MTKARPSKPDHLPDLDAAIRKTVMVSLRLDEDVVSYFRATGKGWHARINSLCRWYMEQAEKASAGAKTRK